MILIMADRIDFWGSAEFFHHPWDRATLWLSAPLYRTCGIALILDVLVLGGVYDR